MRVLTTTLCYPTPQRPDQGVFVQRRAAALARRCEVVVVAPQPWCPLLRPPPPTAHSAASPPSPPPVHYPRMFSIPGLGRVTDGLAYSRALCSAVRRLGRVDLIDAHFEYPDGVGAYLAARRLGLPVVVTLRGKLVALAASSIRRAQIKAMLRGADALIAVSANLATLARRIAGRDLPIDIIPNGVDATVFHPVERTAAKAALGWDRHAAYTLAVGHYQRLKGFDRLLAAWPAVRAANPDARLVLVGSRRGERGFYRRIRHAVASSGLNNCISLMDPVDPATLNLMYAAAAVSLNASRSEGWCNAIAESLAAGTPVVATDVGGNRAQVFSPELGLIVPDGDLQALARAISSALQRNWDRARIAAHGAARNWNQVAREVSAVFERTLGSRSVPCIAAGSSASCSPAPAAGGAI